MTSAKRMQSNTTAGKAKKPQSRSSFTNVELATSNRAGKATPKKNTVKETANKKNSPQKINSTSSKMKSESQETLTTPKKVSNTSDKNKSVKKETAQKVAAKKEAVSKAPVKKVVSSSFSKKELPKKPANPKSAGTAKPGSGKTVPRKKTKKNSSKTDLHFPTTTWGADSIISFEATEHLPPPELTSISGGFVFHGDSVLLANIPGRGWEIIGGRIDLGESPEETFRRETMKQLGVSLTDAIMIGVIRIEHMGSEPPNCPYPFPVGYGVQYIGIVGELMPFGGSDESLGRSLISFEGFKEHYYDWNEYYEAVFDYACAVYKKWRKKSKA
jgi:8-oxo-dGTP diphosphatase